MTAPPALLSFFSSNTLDSGSGERTVTGSSGQLSRSTKPSRNANHMPPKNVAADHMATRFSISGQTVQVKSFLPLSRMEAACTQHPLRRITGKNLPKQGWGTQNRGVKTRVDETRGSLQGGCSGKQTGQIAFFGRHSVLDQDGRTTNRI